MKSLSILSLVCAISCTAIAACETAGSEGEGEGEEEGDPDDIPPVGAAELEPWIESGHYLGWDCEDAPHEPRGSSPHPINRICNNPLLANSTAGDAIPVGAASVKEYYDALDGDIILYAVSLKVAEGGAADADSMYWFAGDLAEAPVADGLGNSGGVPQTACFDCHAKAIEEGGQEQFFTIVR
jgi:hypothetical protein